MSEKPNHDDAQQTLDNWLFPHRSDKARIAKAKAILSDPDKCWFGSPEQYEDLIKRALEALEGK